MTRIAPTPSGFIHLGNAFNFYLISKMAQMKNLRLLLRIDDFDFLRSREEFMQDIFDSLHWLGIAPSEGPKDLPDFKENFSQQKKQNIYREVLNLLLKKKQVYACDCSRSQTERFSDAGAYSGHCRDRNLSYVPGRHALRLRCDGSFSWQKNLNDFVVWTKEDHAAYQLVSVVEDCLSRIDLIVRGEDLQDSSGAQTYLATLLGGNYEKHFSQIRFFHHPLLVNPYDPNTKLSKSLNSFSLKEMIARGYTFETFKSDFEKTGWMLNIEAWN